MLGDPLGSEEGKAVVGTKLVLGDALGFLDGIAVIDG